MKLTKDEYKRLTTAYVTRGDALWNGSKRLDEYGARLMELGLETHAVWCWELSKYLSTAFDFPTAAKPPAVPEGDEVGKAMFDAVASGTGIVQGGKRIDPQDFRPAPMVDREALAKWFIDNRTIAGSTPDGCYRQADALIASGILRPVSEQVQP